MPRFYEGSTQYLFDQAQKAKDAEYNRSQMLNAQQIQGQKDLQSQQLAAQEAARQTAFGRFQQLASPYMAQMAQSATPAATGNSPELDALTASIQSGSDTAQGLLASQMARRGIYQSGPSAAASAQLIANTESNVAKARADYAQQAEQRKQNERLAARQSFDTLLRSYSSQM